MNLYIQVENGQTINHPAFEDNLIQAFGRVPDNWEPFIRVERPVPGVYEVLESDQPTYQKVDGTWTDVWALRPMTDEEKAAKQLWLDSLSELNSWTLVDPANPNILRPSSIVTNNTAI